MSAYATFDRDAFRRRLLGIVREKAFKTGDFTLASGKKSDFYLDCRMVTLDPEGLYRTVRAERISMCGFIPTTVALVAALALGAQRAELVRYGNSGDVSGDFERVVGYAGAVIR